MELPQVYAEAMASFQSGDYAKAAADLEALIAKAEFSPQLEPIFFTLGSAYFNLPDYAKAITAFKAYVVKFPTGPRVGEAALALAQCSFMNKSYVEAASAFAALEKDPRLREQGLYYEGSAYKEAGKPDEAIAALEKLAGTEIKTATAMRGAMLLAQLYGKKGSAEKASATLTRIHAQSGLVGNIIELNAMSVTLGDELFGKKLYAEALSCYRASYTRETIVRMQTDHLAGMQRTIDENIAAARSDASRILQLTNANNQIKTDMAAAQKLLEEFQKLPTITPAIYIRMAQCFYNVDKKWEAIVVYREILDRFHDSPEAEPALFSMIVSLADVNQPAKAQARSEEYLRDFKNGPNAETVGFMLGATALQANDAASAETFFGRMIATQPKSAFREQIFYLYANAKFMGGKYEDAATEYKKYLTEYPKGQNVEEVEYRIALTSLFAGKYENAMKLLQDFLKKYPSSALASDAKYRLAVCKYAASIYDEVIADCKSWESQYHDDKQLGEVLALLADSYAASSREEQAIPIYIRSYKIAATDEVMNYSIFAASKLLQKRAEWEKVSSLFEEFIKEKPDNPTAVTGLYWIGKAKAHEGKTEEAKQITADTIKKFIGDPKREAVEMLLTQLAQLCVKKAKKSAATSDASPDTAASPTPTPADPGAEFDALLGAATSDHNGTVAARILFAKAELARLRRQPAEEQKITARIADVSKPEDLSAMLLGRGGDSLLAQNKLDQAASFYQHLMDEFPKSNSIDYAYNGLGEIAFQKKDYIKALRYFTDATEKIAAAEKLKEVTVGKGKALLALNKLDEAKKIFEQVAAVREWRGESTAFCVFSLGEIEAKREKWAEANAYYQRVFVGYQKFLPWVAKAYIRSAESLEKLGKKQEAANTYKELLRNEKLAGFAEAAEARKRLEAMGQG